MMVRLATAVPRRGTLLLGAALLALSCHRLPDTIPYEARIGNKDDGKGTYRVGELHGADLMLDGRKVARLDARGGGGIVFGQWTGPKTELRSVMTGKYAVSLEGPCAPFSLSAGSPPANWASKSDREIATIVEKGAMPIFLEVDLPKTHLVLVDRGSSTGTLRVGNLVVDPGKKTVALSLPGCSTAPSVTLDGSSLGTLDLGATANLITLEPDVGHVLEEVVYGDEEPTRPPLNLPAKGVVALSEEPQHFLTPAPDSARVPKSMRGSSSSELLRSRCSDTAKGSVTTARGSGAGTNSGREDRDSKVASPTKKAVGTGTQVSGAYSASVQRIVRQNFGRFRLCYENGLRKNPNLKGRVAVKFGIDPSGSVSNAADGGSDIADPDVVACVARSFKTLSFPQPEGGKEVTIVYPISFEP